MELSIRSRKEVTQFAKEIAHIHMAQKSSHVEMTNEDSAHHFIRCQGYRSP